MRQAGEVFRHAFLDWPSDVQPSRRPTGGENTVAPLEPGYSPNYNHNSKAVNERRRAKEEPIPGGRICSRCRELKELEAFAIKDKRTGGRRSMCADCHREYQRGRYLSVEQSNRLMTLLRFIACEEDHFEADCITCHLPIEVGQEVVADDVKLCHAACST
jgi:hypothetical protein